MPVTGEVLEFTASVSKVSNVASLRLLVNGRKQIAGKDTWHLQAFAHTQNPLRMVFELDDQFDSYSVPGDFASVQYEMHLSERGQKVQSVERLTQLLPCLGAAFAEAGRENDIANFEIFVVRIARDDKWGVFRT